MIKIDIYTFSIVAIYAYVLFFVLKKDNYTEMLCLTLAACILLCIRKKNKNNVEGFKLNPHNYSQINRPDTSPPTLTKKIVTPHATQKIPRERTDQIPVTAPQIQFSNMSDYDGLCLKTQGADKWMKSPDNVSLAQESDLYAIQGHTSPTKPVISEPIGGESMFMFKYNKSSPSCCPSTFSTSDGCVCTTPEQRDLIAGRAGNVTSCNSDHI